MSKFVKAVIKFVYPHKVTVVKEYVNAFIQADDERLNNQVTYNTSKSDSRQDQTRRRSVVVRSHATAPPSDDVLHLSYNVITQDTKERPTALSLMVERVNNVSIYSQLLIFFLFFCVLYLLFIEGFF